MYKIVIPLIVLPLLLVACGIRDPDRIGFLKMTSQEMFPEDRRLRDVATAASKGDVEKIDKIIAKGLDVNTRGKKGLPAAFWVLYNPNKEGFKCLLGHGANPNIPLKYTFWGKKYYTSIIHEASGMSVDVDYLKLILDIGSGNPNLQLPDSGERPIERSVYPGEEQSFALLYNAGAEIDFEGKYGTLLDRAFAASNYELGFFLLQKGVGFIKNGKWGQEAASDYIMMAIKLETSALSDPWFWRCVDHYESQGVIFDIQSKIKRQKNLGSSRPKIERLIHK